MHHYDLNHHIIIGHHAFDVQIALKSTQLATALRSLTAEHVGRLLKVSGIIVSAPLRALIFILV